MLPKTILFTFVFLVASSRINSQCVTSLYEWVLWKMNFGIIESHTVRSKCWRFYDRNTCVYKLIDIALINDKLQLISYYNVNSQEFCLTIDNSTETNL